MNPSDRLSAPRPARELQQLSPEQRTIVQLLSVFSGSEPLTSITRALAKAGGRISGRSPKNSDVRPTLDALAKRGVLACQFHPEFRSRPLEPHPLFESFVGACIRQGESL